LTGCVFCRVVRGEARGSVVYSDGDVTAFRDINPQAPVHILIVPNEHIPSLSEVEERHVPLLGKMLAKAREIAASEGVRGYRLVVNCGPEAGQSVDHLHIHLLGGRRLRWPPG